MVTVYDVARHAGLSIASVSRVLNGRSGVSPETVERVRRAAAELDYHPSDIARAMVLNTTGIVGLVVPELTNPFFPELVHGFQVAASKQDVTVLLAGVDGAPASLERSISALRRKRVDGLVVIAGELDDAHPDLFEGMPAVFLDRGVGRDTANSVGVDHELGAYRATRHLLDLGHRRLAHIAGPAGLAVSRRREAGWRRACDEAGIPEDSRLVIRGDFSEVGGYAAAEELLRFGKSFSGVFAANDLSALGALACFRERGVAVPDDISVIGFDGIVLGRYVSPRLTTIAQPIAALGAAALGLLMDIVAEERGEPVVHPSGITLDCSLRLGSSTSPPATQEAVTP